MGKEGHERICEGVVGGAYTVLNVGIGRMILGMMVINELGVV